VKITNNKNKKSLSTKIRRNRKLMISQRLNMIRNTKFKLIIIIFEIVSKTV
jgi:hypothetical protein